MWEKEKLIVTSNFSFSHSVFKRLVSQGRQKVSLCGNGLSYQDSEDRTFNRAFSDVSVVFREITLTISDSIETDSPVESEIVRVVSLRTTERIDIPRFKNRMP